MKAIVIIYEGTIPQKKQVESLLESAEFITGDASVSILDQEKLASMVVSSVKPPKIHTDDGDNAAIYIAGMCRDTTNISKLSVDVITHLNDSVRRPSPELDAFVKSCSIIAQKNPISVRVRKNYKFNNDTIDVITKLYQAWNNGQD